jgi:hypothetical protein
MDDDLRRRRDEATGDEMKVFRVDLVGSAHQII